MGSQSAWIAPLRVGALSQMSSGTESPAQPLQEARKSGAPRRLDSAVLLVQRRRGKRALCAERLPHKAVTILGETQ